MNASVRWQGRTDGGDFGLRSVAWMVGHLGARFVYFMMGFAIPFYLVSRPSGTAAVFRFYRRHLGKGFLKSAVMTVSCYIEFGKVVVDKFAFFGGVTDGYVLERPEGCCDGEIFSGEKGAVLATAHVGNPEAVGSLLHQDSKRMYCLVYAGEDERVLRRRADALSSTNVSLIPVGRDMGYIFELAAAVGNGGVAVMTADRFIDGRTEDVCFLGSRVKIPSGAFAIAGKMGVPVYSLFVMRCGYKRYRLLLGKIGSGSTDEMAAEFARRLEAVVREYPLQWFNFYDYFEDSAI